MQEQTDLFREILHLLGDSLGEVIKEQNGVALFETIEKIRYQSKNLRDRYNDEDFEKFYQVLNKEIESLDVSTSNEVSRAFTLYLILNNIAELSYQSIQLQLDLNKQRSELLESIHSLKRSFKTTNELEEFLKNLKVKITLTQHPTEVRRETILLKEKKIYSLLLNYYKNNLGNNSHSTVSSINFLLLKKQLMEQIEALWLTAEVRIAKPTLKDEIESAAAFANYSLFETFRKIYSDIWNYFQESYSSQSKEKIKFYPILRIGSWVGGDRDGNPFVTVETTKYALDYNKKLVIKYYLNRLDELIEHLSISIRRLPEDWDDSAIIDFISNYKSFIKIENFDYYNDEPFRYVLLIIKYKLQKTLQDIDLTQNSKISYKNFKELLSDLSLVETALQKINSFQLITGLLNQFKNEIQVYKLHWAQLDIRQHSNVFGSLINEIYTLIGKPGYKDFSREKKVLQLSQSMKEPRINFYTEDLSDESQELWNLFKLLHDHSFEHGDECFGSIIISMCTDESDVLEVLLCQYWVGIFDPHVKRRFPRPIVPLFETIDDLERSSDIMKFLWNHETYKILIEQNDNIQEIMIGYSVSGKDGGFLSSQWNIYLVQERLITLAKEYKIKYLFFHGRGGSVGRGGVDIHKAINGLPPESTRYGFKITEQGEVISQKYLHEEIAYSKLTQMMAGIFSAQTTTYDIEQSDREILEYLAVQSRNKYRSLIYEKPDFVPYFEKASPIEFIGLLNIGSRPSKRSKAKTNIEDLRAIPWIFAFTQNRMLLPVWYGIGTAVTSLLEHDSFQFALSKENLESKLTQWGKKWPFFANLLESVSVQLVKADMNSSRKYSDLASNQQIFSSIFDEYFLTRKLIRIMTGEEHLLDNLVFLHRAILARTPYMDPLTLIQVNAIKNYRNNIQEEENLKIILLTITGIAAGMKNTG